MDQQIYFTTSIFYANSKPHIGAATEMLIADFFHRAYSLFEYKSFLLTGTDEHGDKIFKTAEKNNLSTLSFLNEQVKFFQILADKLQISYNRFIRTTEDSHKKSVQAFWQKLEEKGLIYKGEYSGWYSQRDETFYQEKELIDEKAPTGSEVQFLSYECYFLKTSVFRDRLLKLYEEKPFTVPSNRINELKSFINKEYKDLCISRPNGSWGISVPNKPDVIYVWFDALINYLTACGYPDIDSKWNNTVHVIGKDILNFHGIHWPAMLMANDIPLFNKVLVHNWWIMPEGKMSKSLGNVIDPMDLIEKYGVNAVRFFFLKENLMNDDQRFNEELIMKYYHEFLVNKLSNLVYRVQSIVIKNQLKFTYEKKTDYIYIQKLKESILSFNINEYINTCFEWCDDLNRKVEQNRIWQNTDLAPDLFNETLNLLSFFIPLFPDLANFDHKELVMLFQKTKS